MFKIILISTGVLLSACSTTHQLNNTQSDNKSYSDRVIQQFKNNTYYVQELTKDSDLWNESMSNIKQVSFNQLTPSEKIIYQHIIAIRLNQSIECNGQEFLFTGYREFPFFEIMDYKPRVELQPIKLSAEDQSKDIIWRGKIRIGFDQSLARDVVPYHPYTFLKDNPHRSLPNFRSFTTYHDIWLTKDNKVFDRDLKKNTTEELIIKPNKYGCADVQIVLDTLIAEQ